MHFAPLWQILGALVAGAALWEIVRYLISPERRQGEDRFLFGADAEE